METIDLTSSDYWESPEVDLRLNPRRQFETSGLLAFLEGECAINSAVVLATSGSSGPTKFVVLSKSALLHSAAAVVKHSKQDGDDVSLAGLSGFHVGGLGIYARAYFAGSRVVEMNTEGWARDGSALVEVIEKEQVTLTSMTPTHLHDLVQHEVRCPNSLRLVFLGGGRMNPDLIARARELGWPIRVSYGMTEAASQIATSVDEAFDWLPILPHWETSLNEEGCLTVRGDGLFSGYARKEGGEWRFDTGKDEDGWFVTGDRCELTCDSLRFLGRVDDLVKVSGELVSLSKLNRVASALAHEVGVDAAVVAVPDSRRENELVVVIEECEADKGPLLERLNRKLEGIERISRFFLVDQLPRTEIGKLDQAALRRIAGE